MGKMYECICGKSHKSRSTVALHTKKSKLDNPEPVQNTPDITPSNTTSVVGHSGAIQEIDLKSEYEELNMKINPKKAVEEENECSECGYKFSGKPKYCGNCATEFQYDSN